MGETPKARRSRKYPDAALLSLDPKEVTQVLSFYGMNRRDAFGQFLRDYAVSFRLRSDSEGRKEIDHISDVILLADASLFHEATFVNIASECAYFYQSIGDGSRAIVLGKWTLKKAEISGQPNLLRRAHNVLAAAYLSAFYYNEAFNHLSESLRLARQIGEPLFEMAVLANAASLLGEMGLSAEALTIAHRVSKFCTPSALHSYVQIQNACNALRISRKVCDRESADKFFEIANENFPSAEKIADDLARAYFEWVRALHLIDKGEIELANQNIERALARRKSKKNEAVSALLVMAKAECLTALTSEQGIQEAKLSLKGLLKNAALVPEYYEKILRTLINILNQSPILGDLEESERYSRLLRDYLINVKHRTFYAQARQEIVFSGIFSAYSSPSYLAPKWIDESKERFELSPVSGYSSANDAKVQKSTTVSVEYSLVDTRKSEDLSPSSCLDIAENWAIAAEYAAGGSGRHCFRVARVGRVIGRALGFSLESCEDLERAIRLHDIGKIVLDEKLVRMTSAGAMDMYRSTMEHTLAGERLLSVGDDPLMRLGARIARQHHEWWNGCGLPDGLSEDETCIEARICAVADTYISLVDPAKGLPKWSHECAVRQLEAMAGFQLDPNIVSLFINDISKKSIAQDYLEDSAENSLWNNHFIRSRMTLYESLELSFLNAQ